MHRMRYRKLLRFVHTDICRCFFCWANIIDYGQSDHKLIVSNVRLSAVIALKIETVSNQQKLDTIWTGLDLMIFVERRCVQTRATTCKCYYAQEQFCDAHMPFNEKYPIILPSKHRIAYLIVEHNHLLTLHGGPRLTTNQIRGVCRWHHPWLVLKRIDIFL